MRFIFVSYNYKPNVNSPRNWIDSIGFYNKAIEFLAEKHEVICVEQINYEGYYPDNNLQYHFKKQKNPHTHLQASLNKFIAQQKPDVVFIHGTHYPLPVLHLRLLLPGTVKIIVQHHAEQPFNGVKKYLQRLASYFVDTFLFSSSDLGLEWVKKGNIHSALKIKEVMEVSSFFYPINIASALTKTSANGNPMYLWVGRLDKNKDPLTVIKGFLKFFEAQPLAKLYMIYQTEELLPEINLLLENHPNKQAVVLVGKVANADLLYWYNSADFLISGSHYEGSGTAVCEAVSCGCIPLVTNIPAFRMITNKGDCGILYPPGNEDALASALQQTTTLDMEKYRQKCLDWFGKKLSFSAIAEDIEVVAKLIIK